MRGHEDTDPLSTSITSIRRKRDSANGFWITNRQSPSRNGNDIRGRCSRIGKSAENVNRPGFARSARSE